MALRKWGGETQVNTQVNGSQRDSAVASLPDGGFVVVWTDNDVSGDGSGGSIKMQRYSAAGLKSGGETLVNTVTLQGQLDPSVAVLENGSIVVSWQDVSQALGAANDIRFRRFNADGTAIDAADVALFYANGQESPDATALDNGGFAIAFVDIAASRDIFVDIFASNGTLQFHVPVIATASIEDLPSITQLVDGRLVVTWQDPTIDQIRMQVVNASTGALVGGAVNVANTPVNPGLSDVTALAGGGFVVAWTDFNQPLPDDQGNAVRARVFTGGSPPVGGAEFTVNTLPNGNQSEPDLTALPDGGFVAVYTSFGLGGAAVRIMAQLFNANGSKRGGEFVVDTTSSFVDFSPDVAVLADGRIVVTWNNSSTTPNDPSGGIVMQIIDPRDGLVNGTEAAETLFGNDVYGDEINGFGGSDVLHGLAGSDTLYGGDGGDFLFGGRDGDTLFGDAGADRMNGNKGDDILFGGADVDTLFGDEGDDELFGDLGNDLLMGGSGADHLDGGGGTSDTADYIISAVGVTVALDGSLVGTGEAFGDTFAFVENIRGSNASGSGDTLRGDAGFNTLIGNAGNDALDGRANADKLNGGAGIDTLTGGTGNDQFIYATTVDGGDTVTDFLNVAGNNDSFAFVRAVFGNLPAGAILATQFQSSVNATAGTAAIRFFYETDTRILRFDADGSDPGSTPIVIATLQAGATMTFADILMI